MTNAQRHARATQATRADLKEVERVLARVQSLRKAIASLADRFPEADTAMDCAASLEDAVEDIAASIEIELHELEHERREPSR